MKLVNFNTLKIGKLEGKPSVYTEDLIWTQDSTISGFAAQVREKISQMITKPVVFEINECIVNFNADIENQGEEELNDIMECITNVVLAVAFQHITLLEDRDGERRLNIPEDWKDNVFAPVSVLKRAVNHLTIVNALNIIINFTYQGINIGHYNLVEQMEK